MQLTNKHKKYVHRLLSKSTKLIFKVKYRNQKKASHLVIDLSLIIDQRLIQIKTFQSSLVIMEKYIFLY